MNAANTHLEIRREAVVNAHIEAESIAHDVKAALATFSKPRYEVPAAGVIADGAEAVEGLLNQLLGAFPRFLARERSYLPQRKCRCSRGQVRRNASR